MYGNMWFNSYFAAKMKMLVVPFASVQFQVPFQYAGYTQNERIFILDIIVTYMNQEGCDEEKEL